MIYDIEQSYGASAHNGKARLGYSDKTPERSPWEELGWAVLEQAVTDLANFCRVGIVTTEGKCLPWPAQMQRRIKWRPTGPKYEWERVSLSIASCKGPNDHKQLVKWFMSDGAREFCDLVGCKLTPEEIFWSTVKHHGGLPQ